MDYTPETTPLTEAEIERIQQILTAPGRRGELLSLDPDAPTADRGLICLRLLRHVGAVAPWDDSWEGVYVTLTDFALRFVSGEDVDLAFRAPSWEDFLPHTSEDEGSEFGCYVCAELIARRGL